MADRPAGDVIEAANSLREQFAAGAPVIGAWLTTSSAEIAEVMASLGFDFLVVDMEHGTSGISDAVAAFVAAERHGCAPMARLPSADPILARRLLDGGACGLLVPVVEDAATFEAFARHCLYPPAGRRGAALGRFNRWGDSFDPYFSGFRPVLVPQIETRKGIDAAEEIAALEVVDGLFFGPYDMSADLGVPGDFEAPAMIEALRALKDACVRHGKVAGAHQVTPDPAALGRLLGDGFCFIAYGTDSVAVRHALGGFAQTRDSQKRSD